jgi:flavin-dependent dehydrogenase
MRYDYDVIVVGARVAGASTAMLLARAGYDVLLVDRAQMPSDTVSTHAVLRTGILQLKRWGLLDSLVATGTPPVDHITLGFGAERIPFEVRPDFGIATLYAPRRYVLDRLILREAISEGVTFEGRTRLTDVVRDETGRTVGVQLENAGRASQVRARMVVGADGARSRLARLVDAPTRAYEETPNTVHYAYYSGIEHPGFCFVFASGYNTGMIETNEGLTCVFVGTRHDRTSGWSGDPEGEFRTMLAESAPDVAALAADGHRETPFHGMSHLPTFIRRPWGPGWALVGDAGCTRDPISAHGISDALRDAELCARSIDRSLREPDEAAAAMTEYEAVRDRLARPTFDEARALAHFEWEPEEASARMRVMSEAVREECRMLLELPAWPGVDQAISA